MNLTRIREIASASAQVAPPCRCAACGAEIPVPQHTSGTAYTVQQMELITQQRRAGLPWAYIGRTINAVPETLRRQWLRQRAEGRQ